jgi:hypothetical protein
MLGHDAADDLELALSFLGQGGVVGVASGQAEHQGEDARLGSREVDIGLAEGHDPFEVARRVRVAAAVLHRRAHPVHRARRRHAGSRRGP